MPHGAGKMRRTCSRHAVNSQLVGYTVEGQRRGHASSLIRPSVLWRDRRAANIKAALWGGADMTLDRANSLDTWLSAAGTPITTYRGPMPPMGVHRYTLLLFRQHGQISAPMTPADGRANFNVTAFAGQYNLGLPVAVNWFTSQPNGGP